ncbi:YigZ family protein [Paeniglutamicibacter antarcticus]|uniref:YigZ family protein n=1 Tax=Arthrobacter terrae TaxID=2935737 RepID=A0A931CQI2_9MICC|nr:YigZ family protein [Arthrobacter terrae]MBG0741182.1 YigZ family protein [Arthrobacter terrae]
MSVPASAQPSSAAAEPAEYTVPAAGPEFRHELVIKRSRFITVLRRVETEDAVSDMLGSLRKEFYDARHHCSALILGPDRDIQRSNDDGEPSGTAGAPMLEVLRRHEAGSRDSNGAAADLSDVCAVVVRYFGGVLLGAGGLVRAYSSSVSLALDAADLVRRQRLRLFTLTASHAEAGRLEHGLRAAGMTLRGSSYGPAGVLLEVALQDTPEAIAAATHHLAALSAGKAVPTFGTTAWVDVS